MLNGAAPPRPLSPRVRPACISTGASSPALDAALGAHATLCAPWESQLVSERAECGGDDGLSRRLPRVASGE